MTVQHVRVFETEDLIHMEMIHGVNAFDLPFITALAETFASLKDRGAPAVLLSSAHPRLFCPGWNLKALHDAPIEDVAKVLEGFEALALAVFSYPGPTAVAIGGHAVAGGCLLALACDRRLMASGRARLGLSEVNLGVPVPGGCMEMLRARLTPLATERLVLSGDGFSAEGAERLGIVHRAVDPARLIEISKSDLRSLAMKPPTAYRAAKRFMHQATWSQMRRTAADGAQTFLSQWQSSDTKGRISDLVRSLSH